MKRLFALVISLCALTLATAAKADPIGGPGSNCGTCQGATYTLFTDFVDLDANPLTETFRISLFIDTSTLNIPGAVGIDTVAIHVATQPSLVSATLFDAPGGAGTWALSINTTLDANGCNATGGGGWICAGGGFGAVNGTLEWIFDVTVDNGLIADPSIKVRYVDVNGNKIGDLVSENIELQRSPCPPGTPGCEPPFLVSEPSSVALLGMAFLIVGMVANRRRWNG